MELREYQKNILENILKYKKSLVILPTGTGKTLIALYYIKRINKNKKTLMIAPTKALVEQHYQFFSSFMKTGLLTGSVPKKKRTNILEENYLIISTPQTITSDLDLYKNRFDILILDECHHVKGRHAYAIIVENLNYEYLLGLTASPGHTLEEIQELINKLNIEWIEYRKEDDEDIKPYIADKELEYVRVNINKEYIPVLNILKALYKDNLKILKEIFGINIIKKSDLFGLKIEDFNIRRMIFPFYMRAIHLFNLSELLETQDYSLFLNYLEKLKDKDYFKREYELIKKEAKDLKPHNKIEKLLEIIKENRDKKIIVFTQYVDNAKNLSSYIKNSKYFVGKKEINQKEQKKILEEFRKGEFNVLISTSVGEEGLDIPEVDLVIFYEPIPSGIRFIQRKGRTGRTRKGKIIVLITRKTKDESYLRAAKKKERDMYNALEILKKSLLLKSKSNKKIKTLEEYLREV